MVKDEVWITGMGIVSALGSGVEAHREAIATARTGLASSRFFEGNYATDFICGMVPQSAFPRSIDQSAGERANLLCEMACKEALRQSSREESVANGIDAVGLILGTTSSNFHGGTMYYAQSRAGQIPDVKLVSGFLPATVADHVASRCNLTGRRRTVSSACASGTTAIGHAFRLVSSGKTRCVVAGGVDALCPFIVAGFNSLRLLSKKHCSPFDANRDGFNPGEGAALVVVESADSARSRGARPLGRITGYGETLEAFHHTRSNPDGTGIAAVMAKAMAQAGCGPESIDHVQCHGTATVFNDLSEYNGLKYIFKDRLSRIPVCSTKSMTGHTLGAAGAISAVFAILSLADETVPATLSHDTLDPQFSGLTVLKRPEKRDLDRVLTTSLGFGGETASLLIEKAQ
jgi:3-oxoacyl-[acyl-carrier-protein] synthase II